MKTFKINSKVFEETSKIKKKAEHMYLYKEKPSKGVVRGINTIEKYIKEEKDIREMIKLYKVLIYHDVYDVEHIVKDIMERDKNIRKVLEDTIKGIDGGGFR